eukprot:gene17743-21159_t
MRQLRDFQIDHELLNLKTLEIQDLRKEFEEEKLKVKTLERTLQDVKDGNKVLVVYNDPICLNIGGKLFQTSLDTLSSIRGSYFDVMFNGSFPPKPMTGTTNTYFIDRGKKMDLPIEIMDSFEQDIDFYGLKPKDPTRDKTWTAMIESRIMGTAQKQKISEWLPNIKTYTLLYRGSRDGFKSSTFHQLCNDKGATLTVVRSTNGNVFGGYASQSWNSMGAYYGDASTFLFTLFNNGLTEPTVYYSAPNTKAIQYGHPSFLPTFGSGYDLYISDQCNSNHSQSSYSKFPHSFVDTTKKELKKLDLEISKMKLERQRLYSTRSKPSRPNSSTSIAGGPITLNIGGKIFTTTSTTLRSIPGSFFDKMLTEHNPDSLIDGTMFFIDRYVLTLNHISGVDQMN